MQPENLYNAPLKPRIALISIGSFWAFYFAICSVRAAFLYNNHQVGMLGARAIVSLGSAGVTIAFYLAMRRVSTPNLGRSIVLALLLAVPAAISSSALNWYVFSSVDYGNPASGKQGTQPGALLTLGGPDPEPISVGSMDVTTGADRMTPLQSIADEASNGYFFFIAWAALYLALSYAGEVGALERRTSALRAAAQSAELKALRYQVNPHFLFNTLNSLSALVLTDKREQAEMMIINLATFFRTSLTGDPTEDVALSEEIMLQRLYLDIERVRFPERLIIDIDIPDALLGACVPGLILQPLVENAVKHAVARSQKPVTIRIVASEISSEITLLVEDNGDPVAPADEGGTGIGLRNVCDRLASRFGSAATCRWGPRPGSGFVVELKLPSVRHGH